MGVCCCLVSQMVLLSQLNKPQLQNPPLNGGGGQALPTPLPGTGPTSQHPLRSQVGAEMCHYLPSELENS